MHLLVVVGILGLHGVGGQEDGCFWGAVDVVVEDALLHLQEEESLRGVLDQLLRHILWEELGTKLEQQGAFLPHILGCHLKYISMVDGCDCYLLRKKNVRSDAEQRKPADISDLLL